MRMKYLTPWWFWLIAALMLLGMCLREVIPVLWRSDLWP